MGYTLKTLARKESTILTIEEVKNHELSAYNKNAWCKAVDRYGKDAIFLQTGERTIYVVYMYEGIRFLSEVQYTTSLSSLNFSWGYLKEDGVFVVYCYEEGRMEDSASNREVMKTESTINHFGEKKFFTKTF